MEILLTFFSLSLFLFRITTGFHMVAGYNYEADLGRDLLKMWEILQNDFTLLGAQLNFGGLRLGPYHFYLFAPFLGLFKGRVLGVLGANALFFTTALLVVYQILKRQSGRLYAFLACLYLTTSAYFLLAARSPGNAFSYLPMLAVFLAVVFWTKGAFSGKTIILGILLSYSFHSHPVSILVTLPLVLAFVWTEKEGRGQKLLLLGGIFGSSFLPLLWFEMRHDWLILKGVLGSAFAQTLPAVFRFPDFAELLSFAFWGELFLVGLLFLLGKFRGRERFFVLIGLLNLLLYYSLRQSVIHYYFPVFLLVQFLLLEGYRQERWRVVFLGVLIFFNLFFFPRRLYRYTTNLTAKDLNFAQLLAKKPLPNNKLNLLLVNETHLSRVGYEYRFLLKKAGGQLLDEYSYHQAELLLVIDETGSATPAEFTSWEFSEFGKRRLMWRQKIDSVVYYLFSHSRHL